jgi:hypothetical protein
MTQDAMSFEDYARARAIPTISGDPTEASAILVEVQRLYPAMFETMKQKGVLNELLDPKKQQEALLQFFHSTTSGGEGGKLPQLDPRRELPDESVPPAEVARLSSAFAHADKTIRAELNNKKESTVNKCREYGHALGKNYTAQVEKMVAREKLETLKQQQEARLNLVQSTQEARIITQSLGKDLGLTDQQQEEAWSYAESQSRGIQQQSEEFEADYKRTQEVFGAAKRRFFETESITDPATYFDTVVKLAAAGQPPEIAIPSAEAAAWDIKTAVSLPPEAKPNFYQNVVARTPQSVKSAIRADKIFNTLRPAEQVAHVKQVVDVSLGKLENTSEKIDELGRKFIQHPTIRQTIERAIVQAEANIGPKQTATGAIGDVASAVLNAGGGIDPTILVAIGQSNKQWAPEAIYAFLMRDQLKTVFAKETGKYVLTQGAKLAAGATASQAGLAGARGLLGKFGATLLGLTGPEGWLVTAGVGAVSTVVNKTVSFFATAGGLVNILEGKSIPIDSFVALLPIVIIVVLFLFFILPTPFNTNNMAEDTRMTALVSSMGGAGHGTDQEVPGAQEGEPVAWSYDKDITSIPRSSALGCPVKGGSITQGPNGSFSHKGIQAYDFGEYMGAPIYATHDAYVVSVHDGIPPNTFINHSYGNNVLLVGQSASGAKFFTIYAHLLSVEPSVAAAAGGSTLIKRGQIIGYEDATGSTWGSAPGNGIHLHYESRGYGTLTLPEGCP